MQWTVHPARRRPGLALVALVLVGLVATAASMGLRVETGGYTLLFAVLLLGSLTPFFFPTSYELDDAGVAVRHLGMTRRRTWAAIRRIDIGADRALLSPFVQRRWLDRYRAVVLLLDGAPADVREALQARAAALRDAGLPERAARAKPAP